VRFLKESVFKLLERTNTKDASYMRNLKYAQELANDMLLLKVWSSELRTDTIFEKQVKEGIKDSYFAIKVGRV
jgi:hypothetical protein